MPRIQTLESVRVGLVAGQTGVSKFLADANDLNTHELLNDNTDDQRISPDREMPILINDKRMEATAWEFFTRRSHVDTAILQVAPPFMGEPRDTYYYVALVRGDDAQWYVHPRVVRLTTDEELKTEPWAALKVSERLRYFGL